MDGKKRLKYIAAGMSGLFIIILVISIIVTYFLVNPVREKVSAPPDSLNYEPISFSPAGEDLELKGWYLPAEKDSQRTVIAAHGYGGNRSQNFNVSEALVRNGFNVIVFDFRNSGESASSFTTIGQKEKYDILGAVSYIERRFEGRHSIGLIGYSMGAAAAVLAVDETPAVQAAVLDSSFADLKTYLEKNLPVWSRLPAVPFNWFILNIGIHLFGIQPETVSPIEAAANWEGPLFFIHGKKDEQIPLKNVDQLSSASDGPRDQVWKVPEAGHVEASQVAHAEYVERVLEFLDDNL